MRVIGLLPVLLFLAAAFVRYGVLSACHAKADKRLLLKDWDEDPSR
jgi:hypothetical protein